MSIILFKSSSGQICDILAGLWTQPACFKTCRIEKLVNQHKAATFLIYQNGKTNEKSLLNHVRYSKSDEIPGNSIHWNKKISRIVNGAIELIT